MSEAAILRRLKTVDRLRALCLSLIKAKKESDEKAKENQLKTSGSERLSDSEIESLRRDAAEAMRELAKMPPMFPEFQKKGKC